MKVTWMSNHRISCLFIIIVIFCFLCTSNGFNEEYDSFTQQSVQRKLSHFNRQVLLPLDQTEQNAVVTKNHTPSKTKAFFLSLLIPGAGEYYLGSKKMARIFLGVEIGLWAGYLALNEYGGWIEHDYQLFAVSHAGITRHGKDHDFYVDIGNFNDLTQYNEVKLQQRDVNSLYPDKDEFQWKWDKESSREKYSDMRVKTDQVYQSALFVIGGIFINHIVSSLDALRLAKKQQHMSSQPLYFAMTGLPEGGCRVFLFKNF